MAKIRNITTETYELRYAGLSLGWAAPDAVLEIPDDVFKQLVFPETIWSVVAKPGAKSGSEK